MVSGGGVLGRYFGHGDEMNGVNVLIRRDIRDIRKLASFLGNVRITARRWLSTSQESWGVLLTRT